LLALLLLAVSGLPLGAQQEPVLVALVLDTSGSLAAKDQALRQRLAEGVIASLPASSEMAVFAFDEKTELVQPRTAQRSEVSQAVAGLRRTGRYTLLYEAVFDASRYLGQQPAARKAILLVTDGVDTNSALSLQDGVGMARELHIPVFTVGLGKAQERILRRLAKLTGGEYLDAGTAPSELASRIVSVTQALPRVAAAPLPGPLEPARPPSPAAARPDAAEAAASETRRPLLWSLLLGALGAAVLFVLALAVLRRRREVEAAVEAAAAPARRESDDEAEATLVTRRDSLGESVSPTLVLTLKPLLHVTKGPLAGKFFEVSVDSATSLGRAKANDIVIDDRAVSSQHCRIRPTNDGVFELFDLKSTNGTYVNEHKVARQTLSAGDVIKIGETVMQLRMDHMKGSAARPH
jgi:hypothetical protein